MMTVRRVSMTLCATAVPVAVALAALPLRATVANPNSTIAAVLVTLVSVVGP
jgi:hypothetical protein